MRTPRFAAVLLALALASCSVYELDPSLEDGHGHSNGEHIELGDTCTQEDLPIAESSDEHYIGSFAGLEDDFANFPACGYEGRLSGPDGFVQLRASAGERWHVEVEPDNPELDLAVYLLPTCNAMSCQLMVDRCGPGLAEDFTFVAEQAGTYLVGVDTPNPEGGDFEMLVLRTQCGDGITDHGEACDDGNLQNGDGCDSKCRVELSGSQDREVEPNNWHTSANAVYFPGDEGRPGYGAIRIPASLGGPCESDHYALQVPDGASVRATMLTGGEQPCATDHPRVQMMLMNPQTGTLRGTGSPGGEGGGCPSIEDGDFFADDLRGGEYHLMLETPETPPAFDYILQVLITPNPS